MLQGARVYQKCSQLQAFAAENSSIYYGEIHAAVMAKVLDRLNAVFWGDVQNMWLINVCAILVIWLSFWSLIPRNEWWIRGADFPRLQIMSLGVLVLPCLLFWTGSWSESRYVLLILLVAALLFQARMVLPYTVFWCKQVQQVLPEQLDATQQIALMVSNVLTPNQNYTALIALVQQHQPDVLLTLETDLRWQNELGVLHADYPYRVAVPLDNLYGMHLYSRLPILHREVKYILSDDIPSIHVKVQLPSGAEVSLHCLHPQPPAPNEAKDSTLRDAELLIVGKQLQASNKSCIVMGDLNDVAWSRTTRLFQRVSGLLDPRMGRDFMNTFHANYAWLRWSLDHVFHSRDFALVRMQRLPHIGSDHFPILVVLQTGRVFERIQEPLEMSKDDQQDAQEAIQAGLEQAQSKTLQQWRLFADFLDGREP